MIWLDMTWYNIITHTYTYIYIYTKTHISYIYIYLYRWQSGELTLRCWVVPDKATRYDHRDEMLGCPAQLRGFQAPLRGLGDLCGFFQAELAVRYHHASWRWHLRGGRRKRQACAGKLWSCGKFRGVQGNLKEDLAAFTVVIPFPVDVSPWSGLWYDRHGLVVAVELQKKVKDSQNPRDPFGFPGCRLRRSSSRRRPPCPRGFRRMV